MKYLKTFKESTEIRDINNSELISVLNNAPSSISFYKTLDKETLLELVNWMENGLSVYSPDLSIDELSDIAKDSFSGMGLSDSEYLFNTELKEHKPELYNKLITMFNRNKSLNTLI